MGNGHCMDFRVLEPWNTELRELGAAHSAPRILLFLLLFVMDFVRSILAGHTLVGVLDKWIYIRV